MSGQATGVATTSTDVLLTLDALLSGEVAHYITVCNYQTRYFLAVKSNVCNGFLPGKELGELVSLLSDFAHGPLLF